MDAGAAIKLKGATVSLQALEDRCQEYYEKVLAIAKRRSEMSSDDLDIYLEYAFRRYEMLQAKREEIDFHLGFAALVVADIERQQAGHNRWTPEAGRS